MKDITIHSIDFKRTIREDYEQIHDNKFNNLEKMGKFLIRNKLPNLKPKETT